MTVKDCQPNVLVPIFPHISSHTTLFIFPSSSFLSLRYLFFCRSPLDIHSCIYSSTSHKHRASKRILDRLSENRSKFDSNPVECLRPGHSALHIQGGELLIYTAPHQNLYVNHVSWKLAPSHTIFYQYQPLPMYPCYSLYCSHQDRPL